MSELDKISSFFNAKIDSVKSKDDLQNIKTEFFGKNGQITQQFKTLGSLDPEKRNLLRNEVEQEVQNEINNIHNLRNKMKPSVLANCYFNIF